MHATPENVTKHQSTVFVGNIKQSHQYACLGSV